MNRLFKKIASVAVGAAIALSAITVIGVEPKLQLYFSPHVMNDITGEITVDANIRNINVALAKHLGSICAVTFAFNFNREKFDIKTNDNGVDVSLNEGAMVKSINDIESKIDSESENVTITFMDSTLMDNLIDNEGTLFSFTLVSKDPKSLWNSFDTYPIRFVENSLGVITYSLDDYSVGRAYNVEGIDVNVGGYNTAPLLVPNSVDKYITFTDGEGTVKVNDFTQEIDVAPYKQDGEMMIPVRYLTENTGMKVEWDGNTLIAAAYADYRTLKINMNDNCVYINSAKCSSDIKPADVNDRIFIPVSLVSAIYNGSKISYEGNSVTVYIP